MMAEARHHTPVALNEFTAALGARFRAIREGKKIFLRDMARRMGVCINTIRWHEAGARMMRADDLVEAARVLQVEPCALIAQEQEGKPTWQEQLAAAPDVGAQRESATDGQPDAAAAV